MNEENVENEQSLQNLLANLFMIAYEDNVISEDEKKILDAVKLDLKQYMELIDNAKADNIISNDERKMLLEFKKRLLQRAYNISRKDHVITEEEKKLINLLIKTLIHNVELD